MKSQQLLMKRIALAVDISKLTKEEIFEWFQQFNIILRFRFRIRFIVLYLKLNRAFKRQIAQFSGLYI
jgi:hypothetical protein